MLRRRALAAVVVALGALAGCSSAPSRPLTPEERQQAEAEKLRRKLSPGRCNDALDAAREYKESGSGMAGGQMESSRCLGARP